MVTKPPVGRPAAVALPAAAVLLGAVCAGVRPAARVLQATALAVPVAAALLVRAAKPQPSTAAPAAAVAGPPELVTVLVPARDEARVIGALLGDLGVACRDRLAVVVIDDASRDGTAEVAEASIAAAGLGAAGRVVRLPAPCGSKGAVLAAWPMPDEGVVVVLDADARVAPDFVDRVREAVVGGAALAQARRRMLRPAPRRGRRALGPRVLLAALQDAEQGMDDVIGRARLALGGASELRGDGMVLRADALERLGGWPAGALCEDLELASRWYLASGRGVERPPALEIWEQPVLGIRPLLGQRLRWAEGSIRRDLHVVLPAMSESGVPLRGRVEVAAYAGQALMPWLAIGLAACATRVSPVTVRIEARRGLGALAAGYGMAAVLLAWEALGPESGTSSSRPSGGPAAGARRPLARLGGSVAAAAFTGLWPLLLPPAWARVALRPGPPRFARTPHAPADAFSGPAPAPRRAT